MDHDALLDAIPDYDRFLTVDEHNKASFDLARAHPDKVRVRQAGSSRNGDPIYALTVGSGRKNAFLFGCPHPNEPIGMMTLDALSRALVERPKLFEGLDYTWHIVKSIDNDGTKLNEGWFRDAGSIRSYAANFYRPPSYEQVEWTFPVDYKTLHFQEPLPETKILMELIDATRPSFMYSLHNSGFGGAYYYITRPLPGAYDAYRDIPAKLGIPLALGEPEAPYLETLAPAVYRLSPIAAEYDFIEKHLGKDPALVIKSGSCSDEYAYRACGTFTLVTELPYYFDPRVNDLSESSLTRKETRLAMADIAERAYGKIAAVHAVMDHELDAFDSPFKSVFEESLRIMDDRVKADREWANTDETLLRKATKAEEFDALVVSRFYHCLSIGMLVRLARAGLCTRPGSAILAAALEDAARLFDDSVTALEADLDYTPIPIGKLAGVQLLAGIATMRALEGERA